MSTDKTGGPAYPAAISINRETGEVMPHQFDGNGYNAPGMTLLDHFAGLAMQGLIANHGGYTDDESIATQGDYALSERAVDVDTLADYAYTQAAAMLEARAKHLEGAA